jgi:hypothetical protein
MTHKTHHSASLQPIYSNAYHRFEGLNQWLARSERFGTNRPICSRTDLPEAGNAPAAEVALDKTL